MSTSPTDHMGQDIAPEAPLVILSSVSHDVPPVRLAASDGDSHGARLDHAGTEAYGGDHGGGGTFPPFDAATFPSQLLWLAITFGALYYVIANIAGPRIAGILETRRDRIATDMDTAARLKAEADEAAAGYEQTLASARDKAVLIATETREGINARIDARRKEAEADTQTRLDAAEKRITAMKEAVLVNVDEIAADTAGALVVSLVGEQVSAEELAGAVKAAAQG